MLIALAGVLAVFALSASALAVRRRALLRTSAAFPAVLEGHGRPRERVIGVYDETRLLFTGRWMIRRERWSVGRCDLQIDRLPVAADGRAVLELDGGRGSVTVVVDPDDAGALRAWSEAGPSAASSFWRR
ncbi:MAG: DUF2550 family protein [Micrococcaceae bacterium]|nr:DUF2550 family protein [Micrococcaceae bacterium]